MTKKGRGMGRLARRLLYSFMGFTVMSSLAVALISGAVICSYGNGTFILTALVLITAALTAGTVVWCGHCEQLARREDILVSLEPPSKDRKDEGTNPRHRGTAPREHNSGR